MPQNDPLGILDVNVDTTVQDDPLGILTDNKTVKKKITSQSSTDSSTPSGKDTNVSAKNTEKTTTNNGFLTPSMPNPNGLIKAGNIDLSGQPSVKNTETGGQSTVYSFSINEGNGEVLLPRVTPDGRFLSEKEAIAEYHKTGKNLGIFKTPQDADSYAKQLHLDYENGKIVPKQNSNGGLETASGKIINPTPVEGSVDAFQFDLPPSNKSQGQIYTPDEKKQANEQLAQNLSDEDLYKVGYSHLNAGDTGTAKQLFQSAQQKNPNNPKVLQGLGHIAYSEGNYGAAEEYYSQAVNNTPQTVTLSDGQQYKNPDYITALQGLTQSQAYSNNLADAKKNADLLVSESPDNVRSWQTKSLVEQTGGDLLTANDDFTKAKQLYVDQQPVPTLLTQQEQYNQNLETRPLSEQIGSGVQNLGEKAGLFIGNALNLPQYAGQQAEGIIGGLDMLKNGLVTMSSPSTYDQVSGLLQAVQGGSQAAISTAMLTPEGYAFTQGINAADVLTNDMASKVLMTPIESLIRTPKSEIGQNAAHILDLAVTLAAFGAAHKALKGDHVTADRINQALDDYKAGNTWTGVQAKLIEQTIKENTANVKQIQSALDEIPKDAKNPIELAGQLASLTDQYKAIEKKQEGKIDPIKQKFEAEKQTIGNQINEIINPKSEDLTDLQKQEAKLTEQKDKASQKVLDKMEELKSKGTPFNESEELKTLKQKEKDHSSHLKQIQDAIQKQEPTEGVLRNEGISRESELSGVVERDQPENTSKEGEAQKVNSLSEYADELRNIVDDSSIDKDSNPLTLAERGKIENAIDRFEEGKVTGEELRNIMVDNGMSEKYLAKSAIQKLQLPEFKQLSETTTPTTQPKEKTVSKKEENLGLAGEKKGADLSGVKKFNYEVLQETDKAVKAKIPYWESTTEGKKSHKQLFYEAWIPKSIIEKGEDAVKQFVLQKRNEARLTNTYQKGTKMPDSWETLGEYAPKKEAVKIQVRDEEGAKKIMDDINAEMKAKYPDFHLNRLGDLIDPPKEMTETDLIRYDEAVKKARELTKESTVYREAKSEPTKVSNKEEEAPQNISPTKPEENVSNSQPEIRQPESGTSPEVINSGTAGEIKTGDQTENLTAPTEEKAKEGQKSKLQLAKEKAKQSLKEAQEFRKSRNKNLGAIKDPLREAKKQAELDRKAFDDLVDVAREAVNEGIKTVADFAKEIGEVISDLVQKAWDVANGNTKYEDAVRDVEENLGERKFSKQVLKSEDVPEEVKAEVEKNLEYIRRSNIQTVDEANSLIDKVGEDAAANLVMHDSDVHPATRVVMGQVLIKRFSGLAEKSKDETVKNSYLDKAIDVANFVSTKLGTEAGQAIQSFSLFSRLSPEGQLRAASKEKARIDKDKINKQKKNIEKIGDRFQDANKEAVAEVLESKPVKEQIQKAKKTTEERISKIRDDRKKIREKYRKNKGGLLSANGLTKEGIEFMGEMAASYVKEGVVLAKDLVDRMIDELKGMVGESAVSDVLKQKVQYIAQDVLGQEGERLVKGGLKDMEIDLKKLVEDHYTTVEATKKSLADKIKANLPLDKVEAQAIAQRVERAFNDIATRKKKAILEAEKKRFDRIQNKLKTGKKVEGKTLQDEIIKFSNLGAFKNEEFAQVIADKLGVGKLTPEQVDTIIQLSNRIQEAPEGAPKREATEDLLAYRAKIAGTSVGEVVQGTWYANVLSGYQTHEKNGVSNLFSMIADFGVEAFTDPVSIPYLLSGIGKGILRRGLPEALHILKTGRSPIHVTKIETPNVLERITFKGGRYNPLNYAKYVTRAMVAVDVISFQGLKEMRATQLAMRQAHAEGLNRFSKAAWDRTNEILLNTKDRYDSATEQVQKEGLTGTSAKRRTWELMEQNRPQEMVDDSYGFAAKGTFNHETEGSIGAVTDAFAKTLDITIKGTRPLRFIVPFTRIVTNVMNKMLDFSIVGGIRAARGVRGFEGMEKYKVLTREERIRLAKQSALGISATASLAVLAKLGYCQITGAGTGNYKKDQQLRQSGWQPYSIKIGDKYYSYQYTPLMINLSLVGNYMDNDKYGLHASDETMWQKIQLTAWQTISLAANMTWVGSTAGILSAFSDPSPEAVQKKIGTSLGNTAKSFIIPNLYTQLSRQIEEINGASVKQTDGLFDRMIQDVPIARNYLNDKINALGDPISIDASIFISPTVHNKYWDYLNSKGVWVTPPNQGTVIVFDTKTNQDRPITDDEYYNFMKLRGQKIKEGIDNIFENGLNGKTYDEVTKSELQEEISNISTQATKDAKEELFAPKIDETDLRKPTQGRSLTTTKRQTATQTR